jgi:DnaK suppressor protein
MLQRESQVHPRMNQMTELLTHERKLALARLHDYRAAQEQEATPPPSDELDSARALSDVEMHASLIERVEERLRAIDSALNLLEQGRYGICSLCGEDIPVQRLRVLPFATRCVDCQMKLNRVRHVGEGTVDEPFGRTWDLPEEMAESTETSRDEYVALSEETSEEAPSFTPEAASTRRRRGRPRKAPSAPTRRK